jgi:uncharacterized Zn finger protein
MRIMSWGGYWKPYVPVSTRRANALKAAAKVAKKDNRALTPVKIDGRLIARTFWGKAWCENLERYSDFANRLPRGRTYVRNGSVVDLQINKGKIRALVAGSEVYKVTIDIDTLTPSLWKRILADCSQSIASLMDLIQGRFDDGVMARLTEQKAGLFPQPKEIQINCSCPDWAGLCKHAAAVLYGIGSHLDNDPELLFTLRNVDHLELVGAAASAENLDRSLKATGTEELAGDLGEIFGINLDESVSSATSEADSANGKDDIPRAAKSKVSSKKPRSINKTKVRNAFRKAESIVTAAFTKASKATRPETAKKSTRQRKRAVQQGV